MAVDVGTKAISEIGTSWSRDQQSLTCKQSNLLSNVLHADKHLQDTEYENAQQKGTSRDQIYIYMVWIKFRGLANGCTIYNIW